MSRFTPRTRPVEREDFPERPWTAQDEAEHRADTCVCGHDRGYHGGIAFYYTCGAAKAGSSGREVCDCSGFKSIQPL